MRYNYIVLLILSLLTWTYAEELYSDKYDYVNIDEILANDRLRNQYYDCFIDADSCITPDSMFFKSHITEAFQTQCKKCTEIQKQNMDKLAEWFTTNEPEKWNHFVEIMIKKKDEDA
ncbi:ejaculatory bulb-specific protein 3 [Apis cerana]|uniref:Ejaculatory bulb-specific protein n=2 Tax=Apis cerana TaxID=7461 RepID=A0A2A3E4X9_APICC|nr:ejaculatory bulb-specific protein 3 [Apis cerana]PBC26787.1 Ejaculatory bulb-specific protein [Apis cerana cerana]